MDQSGNNNDMPASVEPSVPLLSHYARGIYGDPVISPHFGDEYQVEVPTLFSEREYLAYSKNPLVDDSKAGLPCKFLMGLPISLIWVHKDVEPVEDEQVEVLCDSKSAAKREGYSRLKIEPFDAGSEAKDMDTDDREEKMSQVRSFLVPGSSGNSWNDVEKASFLLALYIFDKNFVQVKKFVESKTMGEILSYYYGSFYRSSEYWRWSETLKAKGKKCVGQRLFSGLRQQELLSRLVQGLSEECQNAMMEVSRTFGDGSMSLEEYVLSLKAMVGMSTVVDAVAIGKGKRDLTNPIIEPSKANQAIRIRPEIPVGKACSSLNPSEIINFLTGNYRLSKARSNDLFWEAVWPRLLDRGWHSEQPNNYNYAVNPKNTLVFLMPGVAKFSRRRLVKGEHYFDSVTDVLNKVASEPVLLDLDREENEVGVETTLEEDGNLPERRRHCYLQPRIPSRTMDMMTFTVVDTSLAGGKTFEVRELKALPLEISTKQTSKSHSDEDPREVSTDESDCVYSMPIDDEIKNGKYTRTNSDNGIFSEVKDLEDPLQNGNENCMNPKITEANVARKRKDHLGSSAPVGKRSRTLSACGIQGTNRIAADWMHLCSDATEVSENGPSHVKLSNTSSSRDSSMENVEERTSGKVKPWPLFDLNEVPSDFAPAVSSAALPEMQHGPCAQRAPAGIANVEEEVNVCSRRQSSRNRPPTTRALEAFAHGFLSINSRKGRGESSQVNSRSRNSQRYRAEAGGAEVGTGEDASGSNSNMVGKFSGFIKQEPCSDS